ncbi:MAG: hypothetical protein GC190_03280 [Alphaproteobacteria bacterium]|nr:hypothetical protein [Alphaproteobacteria bacterium]
MRAEQKKTDAQHSSGAWGILVLHGLSNEMGNGNSARRTSDSLELFLVLEADLERLSRFVEFTPDNYDSYSVETARILMAAAAEVDVVAGASSAAT